MDPAEGAKRMRAMRRHLFKNDLDHWASSFFEALRGQASGQPSGRAAGRPSAPLSRDRGGAQG
jgi:trehalose 6-phosphate synthase